MAATINASTSSGLIQTADTSGTLELQSNGTTELTVASTGVTVADNLLFNSGYGSAAIAYGCRAWVNFNGTGAVAINASGNVSTITDSGTGFYKVNYSNSMPDGNYSVAFSQYRSAAATRDAYIALGDAQTTALVDVLTSNSSRTAVDFERVEVAIFR